MLARVNANSIFVITTVGNYIALGLTIASMMVAGFNRSYLDGAVQLYVGLLLIVLVTLFSISMTTGNRFQVNER
jgi:hypothetical protein